LYTVPIDVAGTWRLPDGELTLEQDLQLVFGTFDVGGISVRIDGGRLRGDRIGFTLNGVAYSGRVTGDAMEGVAKGRITRAWNAVRVP
jgi:hypothetical protein